MVKGIRKRKKMYVIQQNKVKERKNEDEEFMFWSPKLKKNKIIASSRTILISTIISQNVELKLK